MRKIVALAVALLALPILAEAQRLYVIDSGISDLANVTYGPDYTGGNGQDCSGHGTAVATIARSTGAGAITSIRVLDCANVGSYAGVQSAIQWAHADFVSKGYPPSALLLSINYPVPLPADFTGWEDALDAALGDGLTIVLAAGNQSDWTFRYAPSRMSNPIVVAAAVSGSPAWYSNYGPQVDVWANVSEPLGGTSEAAARMAGVAISVLALYPWAPPLHVRNVIVDASGNCLVNTPPGTTSKLWDVRGDHQ